MDDRAIDLAMAVARDLGHVRMVGHSRTVERRGARDIEREARIIDARIEIHEAALQMLLVEGGAMR